MHEQRIARQRLRNQRLAGAPFASPEEALRWLGASQAQEHAVAKWSLAQRASRHDDVALARALADGRILRTHVLRPTWHFVLPEDIRWIQALTGPRVQRLNGSVYRRLELDDAVLSRCRTVIERALEGGVLLTRQELAARLAEAGIQARGSRLAHIVMHLELDAVVCSGVPRGKQQTYALLEERAPQALRLEGDEALAELTRRYFRSRGPATLKDFRWWSSLTAAEAKRGVEPIRSELEKVDADGRTYCFVPPLPAARAPAPHTVAQWHTHSCGTSGPALAGDDPPADARRQLALSLGFQPALSLGFQLALSLVSASCGASPVSMRIWRGRAAGTLGSVMVSKPFS